MPLIAPAPHRSRRGAVPADRRYDTARRGARHPGPWAGAVRAVLFTGLLLSCSPVHAGTLHLALDALPCPSREGVAREVASQVVDLMQSQPDLALLVSPDSPQSLSLRLVGTAPTWERTLEFVPTDCPVLPSVLALLLRSWLSRPLVAAAATAGEASPRLPPAPAASPPPADTGPARVRLTALVGLFESFGSDGAGPAVSLTAEYSVVGPLGIAIAGAWDSAVHAQAGGGSLSVSAPTVGLLARVTPRSTESFALDLFAGPALALTVVQSRGLHDEEPHKVLTDAAFTAAGRLRVRLGGPVWWSTSAELAFRRYRDIFVIDGNRSVLSVDPRRIRVLTGLTFEAF